MHEMKLVDFAFQAIKNGNKDIEVRLNDEQVTKLKEESDSKNEEKNLQTGDNLIIHVVLLILSIAVSCVVINKKCIKTN